VFKNTKSKHFIVCVCGTLDDGRQR